jgi:hypothetical protein
VTARSIGELATSLAGGRITTPKGQRTFQPVRRNSRHAGEREHRIWRPIGGGNKAQAHKEIGAAMKAAEFYDRRLKQEGKKNGALGHIGLEVLRELYRIVDFKTGRLEPAIATICDRIKRSRAAVVAAMARLKQHGFLDWIRRTEPTNNEGAGPQVRQIPNAYGFGLPAAAMAHLKRMLGKAPPPDDDVQRRQEAQAETEAMYDSVDLDALGTARVSSPSLAEAINLLGRGIGRSASSVDGQNPAPEGL